MSRTFVIGVGMTKFEKPGSKDWDYPDMAKEAGTQGARGRRHPLRRRRAGLRRLLLRRLDLRPARGLRARPHRHPGRQRQQQLLDRLDGAVHGAPGDRGRPRRLRARARLREDGEGLARASSTPTARTRSTSTRWRCSSCASPRPSPPAPQMFGNAGREHMERYGSQADHFAWIGWKNHKHSVNNPYAQFQDEYSLEDIKAAKMIHEPLTKLQCSPTSDGSGAAIVASRALRRQARPVGPGDRDRRPGDGHRHGEHVRRALLHQDRRLRHDARRPRARRTRRRRSRSRTSRSSSCTTASAPTS